MTFEVSTIGGNIFIFKNYDLIHVTHNSGSAFSANTSLIIQAAQEMSLNIISVDGIDYNQVLDARECIIDHLSLGPQVVIGIGDLRFSNTADAKRVVSFVRQRIFEQ